MINFQSDYVAGCHPNILKRLAETNLEQTSGYGEDAFCEAARAKIRAACGAERAGVHFLVGGTQANMLVISAMLRPHQGVLCAHSGHINVHETGAIEATGHKVLALPSNGKITADKVEEYILAHRADPAFEHTVQPGMVYISFPTENALLYSQAELTALYAICKTYGIPLFIDGARLGYGLGSPACDITLPQLATLCDVFYIGGTKCGALFGEAVVITNPALDVDFRYMMKQRGAMLAKGRLLGLQFDTLFTGDLYFSICRRAVAYALRMRDAFVAKGIPMMADSPTNQQFPLLTAAQRAFLAASYGFEQWAVIDEKLTAVRFCTSWATTDAEVDALVRDIAKMP